MKKALSLALAALMTASLAIGGIASVALTYTNPTPLVMVKGDVLEGKDTIRVSGDYGIISSAKVTNGQGVIRLGKANASGVEVEAIKVGKADIQITSYTTDTDGHITWHTVNMSVNVVSESEKTASMGVDADIVLEYGQKYMDKRNGYYQIVRCASSDSGVATASRGVDGDLEYPVIQAGQKKGEVTISVFYRIAGQSGENEAKLKVTVIAPGEKAAKAVTTQDSSSAGASSSATSSNTSNTTSTESSNATKASVAVGETTSMTDSFYKVSNVTTNSASVATAKATGSEGTMSLDITGVSAGTATITFDTQESASASPVRRTVAITVTGSAAAPTRSTSTTDAASSNAGNSTKGVYLSTRSYKTKVGAQLYANVRIDGVKISRTVDTEEWANLRWVSSNTKVLTVDSQTGRIKAVAKGTAKLIVVDKDGKSCDAMTITVQ